MNSLVSIIVPMYNSENTIEDCINSLINQTYKNIEILVIDDCSNDNSSQIVKDMNIENVFMYKTKVNGGCYKACNFGLQYAKGDYITIHGSDDMSAPNRFEKQMKIFEDSNVEMVSCNFVRSGYPLTIDNLDDVIKKYNKSYFAFATLIFKREVFDKYGKFRDDYRHSMDQEFVERIYFKKYKKKNGFISSSHICNLFENNKSFKDFFEKVDKLLYISKPMNENNLTNKFKLKERYELMIKFRKDIKNGLY